MSKQTNSETIIKYDILPHLDYCTIERAAQLLECEIDDLAHFIAQGRIAAYEFLNNEPGFTHHPLIDFPDGGFNFEDDCEYDEIIYNSKIKEYSKKRFDEYTTINIHTISYERDYITVSLFGFWRICPTNCFHEKYFKEIKSHFTISVMACTSSDKITKVHLSERKTLTDFKELYIKQNCLIRLRDSLASGKPLSKLWGCWTSIPSIHEQQTSISPERKQHGNSERFAIKREIILKAAIYAKSKWPVECGNTGASWAKYICDMEFQLFEDEKAPMSEKTIAELLNATLNDGALSKNK
ncbi:hypothetical protein D3C85_674380 [compost metagenome]